jgi:hypothetical protein
MDTTQKLKVLQTAYAGALADAALQYAHEGVLEKVAARKSMEQNRTGGLRAQQFGITQPRDVPLRIADIFGCASWTVADTEGGFNALSATCLLCAIAKKMGAPRPCELYCLNPMRSMIQALAPSAVFEVKETLWEGKQCQIHVANGNG